MTFSVGDEVICVDAKPTGPYAMHSEIRCGAVYTVALVNQTCCAMHELRLPKGDFIAACIDCGDESDGLWHYDKWRFIKLPKEKARTEPIEVGVE